MTLPSIGSPRCRLLLPLLLLVLVTGTAQAGLPNEGMATAAGQALVEIAASGKVDEAFKAAADLSSPSDTALSSALQARQTVVRAQIEKLGGLAGRVRVADLEPSIFSGCLRREYRVHYTGGDQRWLVKFRRTAKGWTLADLEVVGEPDS